MKIPITDQFLWDLYSVLDIGDDILRFMEKIHRMNYRFSTVGLENPIFKKYRKDKNRQQFSQMIYHLKKNNYIQVKNLKNKKAIMLTKNGFDKALRASFIVEGKKKRKDGKWIMIAFDIPRMHIRARNLLMSVLRNLGYKIFQQSVWVTPYDVSDKTEKLLQYHSLDGYVRIFVIEEL